MNKKVENFFMGLSSMVYIFAFLVLMASAVLKLLDTLGVLENLGKSRNFESVDDIEDLIPTEPLKVKDNRYKLKNSKALNVSNKGKGDTKSRSKLNISDEAHIFKNKAIKKLEDTKKPDKYIKVMDFEVQ